MPEYLQIKNIEFEVIIPKIQQVIIKNNSAKIKSKMKNVIKNKSPDAIDKQQQIKLVFANLPEAAMIKGINKQDNNSTKL